MNVTLDDTSPQMEWYGNWTSWRPLDRDPWTPQYYRGTFHGTPTEAAYMRLAFNGTGAWVYGSTARNHGAYSARIDGGPEGTYMGYAENRTLNQLLYYAAGLSKDREHVLEIWNRAGRTGMAEPAWWFDIDYVIVELPVPENLVTTIIDDSAAQITYSAGFKPKPDASDGYYNVTAHQAARAKENFTLPFTGSSIQLFGTISPETGNFSVSVDGKAYGRQVNATWYEKRTNSPLFFISGLSEGEHSITLTNTKDGSGESKQAFEFDYAVFNSSRAAIDAGGGNSSGGSGTVEGGLPNNPAGDNPSLPDGQGSSSSPSTDASSTIPSPIGAIIGGVVGGIALLALMAVGWYLYRKKQRQDRERLQRRREAARLSNSPSEYTGSEVKPFTTGDGRSRAGSAAGGYGRGDGMERSASVGASGLRGHGRSRSGVSPDQVLPPHGLGAYAAEYPQRGQHGYAGTRTADSRSEYSQSTDHQHPGFAFLTDPNAPPVPHQHMHQQTHGHRSGRDLVLTRPSSPGAMSAYTGYESTGGPAPSSQARQSVMLPSASAGSSSLAATGTATGTTGTWISEKDALRRHLYRQDREVEGTGTGTGSGTLISNSRLTLSIPSAPHEGQSHYRSPQSQSPAASLGDAIRGRSQHHPRAYTDKTTSEGGRTESAGGVETMSDAQRREARDQLGRLRTHGRKGSGASAMTSTTSPTAGHRSGRLGSSAMSPDSTGSHGVRVPAEAPPGYSESVAGGAGRRSTTTRGGRATEKG